MKWAFSRANVVALIALGALLLAAVAADPPRSNSRECPEDS